MPDGMHGIHAGWDAWDPCRMGCMGSMRDGMHGIHAGWDARIRHPARSYPSSHSVVSQPRSFGSPTPLVRIPAPLTCPNSGHNSVLLRPTQTNCRHPSTRPGPSRATPSLRGPRSRRTCGWDRASSQCTSRWCRMHPSLACHVGWDQSPLGRGACGAVRAQAQIMPRPVAATIWKGVISAAYRWRAFRSHHPGSHRADPTGPMGGMIGIRWVQIPLSLTRLVADWDPFADRGRSWDRPSSDGDRCFAFCSTRCLRPVVDGGKGGGVGG